MQSIDLIDNFKFAGINNVVNRQPFGVGRELGSFRRLLLPKYGTIPTPNISEWRTRGDYFLTTFHVHDIPKYSVILHDCVIILMSRDRVNTFVIHRWCAFQRITRNIKE